MENGDFSAVLEAIRQENAAAHAETRRYVEVVADATRREFRETNGETRRHFDIVSEATRKDVRLLAGTVSHVQEELVRTREHLEMKIEESAAETRAMIKVSHGDLDRRVISLEQGQHRLEGSVSNLERRVGDIESKS